MTSSVYYSYIDSPLGQLVVQSDGRLLTGLFMPQHQGWCGIDDSCEESDTPFVAVRKQLVEYFEGKRHRFDIPIQLAGTTFQRRVWQELMQIPFGETISYGQLAERLGNPSAVRAVGNANARNPISIIVPCHRVIGANGSLTGYAGSLPRKQWLLQHEGQRICSRH